MLKILIAPDSFKGTLSSSEVCNLVEKHCDGFIVEKLPLADGGEGSIDVIAEVCQLSKETCIVLDPLGRPIKSYLMIDKAKNSAYIELAKSSGLSLLSPHEQDPLKTSTYGVGIMIRHAVCAGCTNITIFAGGSATNDAGIGALAALGSKFYAGNKWIEFPTGQDLATINHIDMSESIISGGQIKINIAGDVNNPFYGANGASVVYGPQKGATPDQVNELDEAMRKFANWILTHKKIDLQQIPGSGAAGGFSGGMHTFLDAKLISGSELLLGLLEFDQKVQSADLVITGEGRIDSQSFNNKLVSKVLEKSSLFNKPVYGICGSISLSIDEQKKMNFKHIEPMARKTEEIRNCIANPYFYLGQAASRLLSIIKG